MRQLAIDEKPLAWVGSGKRDFFEFPDPRQFMAKRNESNREQVLRGTGNVFADLGYPDAGERQTKLRLAYAINEIVDAQKLTQAATAEILAVNQPKISALLHYKLEGFSVERLMTFLTALGRDVEISIKKKSRSRSVGRIIVLAAY